MNSRSRNGSPIRRIRQSPFVRATSHRLKLGHNGGVVTFSTLQNEKRSEILRLAQEHGASSIRVFGSVVRGENRADSDVDFLVEFEKDRTLFDLIGLRLDLKDLLGVEVDVVTPNSLNYMRERVVAEARPL